ncbi:MAG: hypothetical protein AAF731_01150 [Bacteroidota bacterium]
MKREGYLTIQLMSAELKAHKEEASLLYQEHFIEEVCCRFDYQVQFFTNYKRYVKQLQRQTDKAKDIAEIRTYFSNARKEFLRVVDTHFSSFESKTLDEDFQAFSKSIDIFIGSLERRVKRPQVHERFDKQPGDSFYVRVGKFQKRLFYSISKWPEKISNAFRKLFKKPVKELRPWNHTVFYQRLSRFYLKEELLRKSSLQMDLFYLAIIDSSKRLWRLDAIFDEPLEGELSDLFRKTLDALDQIKLELSQKMETFRVACQDVFQNIFEQFEDAYYKAGTIELTNNRFNPRNLKKKHDRLTRRYARLNRGWHNTIRVMSDDWEIDLELYSIIHSTKAQFYKSLRRLTHRIDSGIIPNLESLVKIIQDKVKQVELCKPKELKRLLNKDLKDYRAGLLAHTSKRVIDTILGQDLPSLINEVEADIDRGINNIETRRAVVSKFDYNKPVRSSAMSYVSPFELINFESWPQFKKAAQQVKVETTNHINNIVNTFQSLSQIAEFNMESAIALFEDESEGDPKIIALEGLSRTAEKIKDVQTEIDGLKNLVDQDLGNAVESFNESLIKFTNNEKIFDIKVRIARAMAVERSRHFRDRVVKNFKNAIPTILRFISIRYKGVSEWVKDVSKRYGINTEQEVISTELVDFLAETENSIDKLPFVYQRLFRSQPLDDLSFYESRSVEIRELSRAYNNWMKNRFAPAIVVGEKGSGLTTMLHFAIEEIGSSKQVVHISLDERIIVPDDIATFFSNQLGKKFKGLEELVNYLKSGSKCIIVIENLQRMYLRRVGGFDCLMELLQLITITSRNVFWMVGCTLYAWNYLEKTMKLSEHFGYVVKLREFNSDQIISMIDKRHRVSGYNVRFEPAAINITSKKFKGLDDKGRQTFLRKQYFDDLNKIAKSNISLALLYWLRSTSAVSASTISIGGLRDIDFSFLNSYGQDKLFGLTQLVLHDGLSEEDFMKVSGKSSTSSRNVLYPLYDDGILIEEDGIFSINPLLYRQVVSLLKTKNIIH